MSCREEGASAGLREKTGVNGTGKGGTVTGGDGVEEKLLSAEKERRIIVVEFDVFSRETVRRVDQGEVGRR
jgi:hypothetical protein